MVMEITTAYGDRYLVHSGGRIQRTDMKFEPSDTWRMRGLASATDFKTVVLFDGITQEWIDAHPLLYKDGHPRYTVADVDHGTNRVWGNTVYHGVASIRLLP